MWRELAQFCRAVAVGPIQNSNMTPCSVFSQLFCSSNTMIHRILCAASWILLMQNVPGTLALPGIERFLYLVHSRNATMFNEMPVDTGIERRVIADQPILTFLDICNNVSFLELCRRHSVTYNMIFAGNRAEFTVQYRMLLQHQSFPSELRRHVRINDNQVPWRKTYRRSANVRLSRSWVPFRRYCDL